MEDIESAVSKRVIEFIKAQNMSETEFACYIGISQSTLNKQIRGGAIMLRTLLLILEKYPTISADYFMRGDDINKVFVQEDSKHIEEINKLSRENDTLKTQVDLLFKVIDKLSK